MPMSSKFLTESTGEKIVKIGQYLAKIWTKNDSLVFLGHPVYALCRSPDSFKSEGKLQTECQKSCNSSTDLAIRGAEPPVLKYRIAKKLHNLIQRRGLQLVLANVYNILMWTKYESSIRTRYMPV